ncbi:MAG: amidohydrolase [Planctomycetes bacterium]|nr:amidohydrolase [Planctomycetota bacterium]
MRILVWCWFAAAVAAQSPTAWLDAELESLESLYRHFHRHPELSFQEKATSARLGDELAAAGFEVVRGIGGTGLVGVMKNGDGPVGLLRADMDALPIAEQTGLPYASPPAGTAADGQPIGVMHACGHDVHMTCLVGTARWAAAHRDAWHGTLLLVGQPAEERGAGAKAMMAAGIYDRVPKPDFLIALHTFADGPTGTVGVRPGFALANVDSVDITMFGRGGHGSTPHKTIDPIVQAAQFVTAAQTIVAREIDPLQPAVVTVGSIHGGSKHNIIGDRCHLQLTLRSYDPKVRQHLMEAVARLARSVAEGARAPAPEVTFSEGLPSLYNSPELTAKVRAALCSELGESNVFETPASMGAEDFGLLAPEGIPVCMFQLGTVAPDRLARLRAEGAVPALHSALYHPDARAAIRTGVRAHCATLAALMR